MDGNIKQATTASYQFLPELPFNIVRPGAEPQQLVPCRKITEFQTSSENQFIIQTLTEELLKFSPFPVGTSVLHTDRLLYVHVYVTSDDFSTNGPIFMKPFMDIVTLEIM
jgi:hypothetical protein